MNSPWIHYLFHDFTLNSLSYSLNHYKCTIREINMNLLSDRDSTLTSISYFRNHYDENIICFASFLWIPYLLRDFTMNALFFSHHLVRELTICFANFLRIHFLLWFHFLFANSLLILYLIHKSLWINYFIIFIFANSLSFSRIHL